LYVGNEQKNPLITRSRGRVTPETKLLFMKVLTGEVHVAQKKYRLLYCTRILNCFEDVKQVKIIIMNHDFIPCLVSVIVI
jgi:hypothetical protein